MIDAAIRRPLRWAATGLYSLCQAYWYLRRPRTQGVHAVAITPKGHLVLVRLRYAPGWRLPGGGRSKAETPREAVLRELREEIGMRSHGAVELVSEEPEFSDFRSDFTSLFIVRDVEYRPRWTLEIEAITEASPHRLPDDLSERTRKWILAVRPLLVGPGEVLSPP
ncbi:NUDIX domain-containing protein [Sphingosinicella sp. CPCC 101087]|uniref:NUDIX domain-containing protein n=1 Tax=Sphingosinicella sp. CPCC 101087 TaxID=2497754 RepID=UPI0019825E1E|nr:NUDIX domain-containing protein [Sphingosinicella sp. CPCC 101087]